jgi:hypothetical protein
MLGIARIRKTQPLGLKKKVIELKVAGPIGRWMVKHKWAGQTTPLPFIIFIFYWVNSLSEDVLPKYRIHEFIHVSQDERNSFFLVTWVNYGIELWKNGYSGNKYEREAYRIQQSCSDRRDYPEWAKPATKAS